MAGSIFYIQDDGEMIELSKSAYENEAHFQELIGKYPNILAGDQIDSEVPKAWIHIGSEVGLPDIDGGGSRFSIDHLFIDQDAVPTIVEVKLSSNPESRRKVVGQMLDYAANASAYLPVSKIIDAYEINMAARTGEVRSISDIGVDDEGAYWDDVSKNLAAGKIRLLFVADKIHPELQRIIEFLNKQMPTTDVLGIEIDHYKSLNGNSFTLVPRVIGKADISKPDTTSIQWNEQLFMGEVKKRYGQRGDIVADVCRNIIEEFSGNGCDIRWGTGKRDPTFIVMLRNNNGTRSVLLWVYLMKKVNIQMAFGAVKGEANKMFLKQLVERINGVSVNVNRMNSYPSYPVDILTIGDNFNIFVTSYKKWLIYAADNNVYEIGEIPESYP